ncbi:hypothetical protein WS70_17605 [Burkholderia mayonis]|uniref:Uncharacterized protein n=2 Tax=Burkholderia mayonis TaxID=1385591 RepID=A0A1B4FJ85_9BURK|nr:hypothetical protein WS70_17605 [Burkholderia mayonis]KVE46919.1 hypothetical protein WS70_01510 [Burkholderia mayonis]
MLAEYPAPQVPSADANGGIRYQDVQAPDGLIQVRLGPVLSPQPIPGDLIELFWGEDPNDPNLDLKPPAAQLTIQEVTTYYVLNVRAAFVFEVGSGMQPVFFRLRTSSAWLYSEVTPIDVKLDVPGGFDPESSTEWINENLSPPVPESTDIGEDEAAKGVDVSIAPWENMDEGDRLTLAWSMQRISHPPLESDDVNQRVVVHVPPETIQAGGDGDGLIVRYEIYDRVKNWSKWSLEVRVNVEVDPNLLAAPLVVLAPNGELNLDELGSQDVQVMVTDTKIAPQSQIELTWNGQTADGNPVVRTVRGTYTGAFLFLNVPNEAAVAVAQGLAVLSYTATLASVTQRSRRTTVRVIGRPLVLPAPAAEHVGPDGVLDPVDVPPSGEPVLVTYDMLPGDTVILRWRGRTNFDSEPKIVNRESSLSFNVPRATIIEGAAAPASIFYDVASDASDPTESQRLPVTVNEAQLRLPAPWVLEATGPNHDQLRIAAYYNAEYIIVQVRRYDDMASADTVRVQWVAAVTYNTDVRPVVLPGHMDFRIPRMEVIDAIGRDARISYSVQQRLGGPVHPSDTLILHVEGQSLTLPAPTLDGARTQVTVLYSGMEDDQTVRVRWDGVVTRHTEIQRVVKGQPSVFDIPAAWVTENSGSRVLINYSVGWIDSDAQLQFSRVLRINL